MFLLAIYFLTIFLCLSSYVFYPIAVWGVGNIFPFKVKKNDIISKVSIIISAYNEAKNIEQKIINTLSLKYPKKNIEILIGSDGSTDNTSNIVEKYNNQGIHFVDFKINRGKTAVQNDLVNMAKGEILIFTDAASFLHFDAVKKIVRNFADDRVGCVAGRMHFIDTESNLTTQSQGLYWRYEVKIRELESSTGNLIGVDGPLYAVRRQSYIPLEHNMISDLLTPLLVLEQGKKVVLEPGAVVNETPTVHTVQEFNTRRRIVLRGLVGIFSHKRLLNPLNHPILSFQIFLHKVLRWFVGPLVIINFLACLALSGLWFFKLFLLLYALFFFGCRFWMDSRKTRAKNHYFYSTILFQPC